MRSPGALPIMLLVTVVLVILSSFSSNDVNANNDEVLIVVTFPNLYKDLKHILCRNEKLYLIVYSGLDPHNYQVSPKDVVMLRKADVVISSGHTSLEQRLKFIVEEEKILDISTIEGIKVKLNNKTRQPNFHLFFLDPDNYIVVLSKITEKLNSINRHCTTYHLEKLAEITKAVKEAKKRISKINNTRKNVIASSLLLQYAIEWVGFDVKEYLVEEYKESISLRNLKYVNNMIEKDKIDFVVIAVDEKGRPLSKLDKILLDIAQNKGISVLKINIFSSNKATYEIINEICEVVEALGENYA